MRICERTHPHSTHMAQPFLISTINTCYALKEYYIIWFRLSLSKWSNMSLCKKTKINYYVQFEREEKRKLKPHNRNSVSSQLQSELVTLYCEFQHRARSNIMLREATNEEGKKSKNEFLSRTINHVPNLA